ncbi:transcriptional regulator, ArsR family [Ruegeria halocynthiae]|uniref:Transcriptional regulator, ArsR family n=1 Tax=Ruegeria halocynthiae TaxID=985054 RepID=A0A1H2UGB8_9RHOB|nr:metalloregulator ArsR/SmtB family transcription factor [Ruegeria halocynthiae]SDW55140.1 transcriptional regulator, ArsR family [Ruegeria halocynthiae]
MAYDNMFSALGDSTRRQVFEAVAECPRAVGDLAADLPVSRPAVSQHLKVLSDAGLVVCRAEGTRRIYAARPEGLADLRAWLERYWSDALESFAAEVNKGRDA